MTNTHNTSCHISSICQIYSKDLNIPNIFHKYFITEHVIFHFCLIAGRKTILGSRAASGPEELRDSERTYASRSTHAYLGTAGRGTHKPAQGDRVGCERAGGAV